MRTDHHHFLAKVGPRYLGDDVERVGLRRVIGVRDVHLERDRNRGLEHAGDPVVLLGRQHDLRRDGIGPRIESVAPERGIVAQPPVGDDDGATRAARLDERGHSLGDEEGHPAPRELEGTRSGSVTGPRREDELAPELPAVDVEIFFVVNRSDHRFGDDLAGCAGGPRFRVGLKWKCRGRNRQRDETVRGPAGPERSPALESCGVDAPLFEPSNHDVARGFHVR